MFGISGSEAIVTIVMKMRDEATKELQKFGANVVKNRQALQQLATGATTVGVSFIALGSVLKDINNPLAQTVGGVLSLVGGILAFIGTAGMFISAIGKIIAAMRSLAIIQTIVKALSGPVGWAQIGIGLAVAGAATAGIYAMTRGSGGGGGGGGVTINTAAVMGNQQQARQLAHDIQRYNREDARLGR
ncbi:MAG: hypothetical protein M0R06_12490 [Sphaerochaeta sp.]|jgi:hypothetical protein|nr:hypothetical protein [Sphaerochaeta sp.]